MRRKISAIRLLNRYVNHGSLGRIDKMAGIIFPSLPFSLNAPGITRQLALPNDQIKGAELSSYTLKGYSGTNNVVFEIQEYLAKNLRDDLAYSILHGSLATNEEIPYSDFDGLVILKDKVFESSSRLSNTAKHLCKAHSLMMKLDPLQHHGWFVLCESDLNNWPAVFFPPEILPHSVSLLKTEEVITIHYSHQPLEYGIAFMRLVDHVIRQLQHPLPSNAYLLKGLLSEFMLLPSLFIQAKTGKGIFKKESFLRAASSFDNGAWNVMNRVSQIRLDWKQNSKFTVMGPRLVNASFKKSQISKSGEIILNDRDHLLNDMLKLAELFKNTNEIPVH